MAAFLVFFGGELDGVPVEAVVLVEAPVLGGDHGVLKIGRDFAEGNELVAQAVGLVVDPGLDAALDVDCGGGRVDPLERYERERGHQPAGDDGDRETAQN